MIANQAFVPMEPIPNGDKPVAQTTLISDHSSSDFSAPTPTKHSGILGRLCDYEAVLDRKFGVEAQGPERILPEERKPEYEKWWNQAVMALLWASGTMNLSCFTTGFLGWEFGLSLKQTVLITIFGTLIGSAVTVSAYCEWVLINELLKLGVRVGAQRWARGLDLGRFLFRATASAGGLRRLSRS